MLLSFSHSSHCYLHEVEPYPWFWVAQANVEPMPNLSEFVPAVCRSPPMTMRQERVNLEMHLATMIMHENRDLILHFVFTPDYSESRES